jgi:capsular exopolysaccharide synthesis family protein
MIMSRIQNILEKAEREGAVMRTSRMGTLPAATATIPIDMVPDAPIEPPVVAPAVIAPAAVATAATASLSGATGPLTGGGAGERPIDSYTVRLNPLLVAGLAPKAVAAEQYRALRTRLSQTEGATAVRTLLVTSPQKGEGKSITSANLALTMAQELQRRVAIVEADLRKPSLQHLFGLPAGPGLSEYLTGAAELKDVMKFLPQFNLTVITAGMTPMNPAELLGSTAMRRMLDHLRTRFDRVILDTPPVLPLADVAILAPLVDGALLVVRAGHTPKPAIENALRAFDSSRLLGIVLNEAGMEADYRYESPRH